MPQQEISDEVVTFKSDKLLADLADANIVYKNFDKTKAQLIIRQYFCDVHNEAVLATVMASNKQTFKHPQFFDI